MSLENSGMRGEISGTEKFVDFYDDATKKGKFKEFSGSITATIQAAHLESPKFSPFAAFPAAKIQFSANFKKLSGSIGGAINFDESQPTNEQLSTTISIAASSTTEASITGMFEICGNQAGITGTASTTYGVTGNATAENKMIKLKGSFDVDALKAEVWGFVELSFIGKCEKKLGSATITPPVSIESNEITIIDFNDA